GGAVPDRARARRAGRQRLGGRPGARPVAQRAVSPPRRPAGGMKARHEDAVLALALAAAAVPACVALPLLWLGDFQLKTQVTLTLAIALGGGGFALAVRSRVQRPLQTVANLIAALRERD